MYIHTQRGSEKKATPFTTFFTVALSLDRSFQVQKTSGKIFHYVFTGKLTLPYWYQQFHFL